MGAGGREGEGIHRKAGRREGGNGSEAETEAETVRETATETADGDGRL